ncbi:hypothetical protein A2U01_0056347, partial [Trifolium medium]|nr:hypothetical protein [Trifolium medium]
PPRVEVDDSNPLKEAQTIETLPTQENKGEHTLPTPTAVLVSEQEIVQEPPVNESGPQVEDTQPSELEGQGVAEIQPNPEITHIEAEKDATPHLEVEHSLEDQHSSPHTESQAEHVIDTDEFINNDSSAGYERTPRTG